MISLLWRFFPGPAWFRVIAILIILAIIVWGVVYYLFPFIQSLLPAPLSSIEDPTAG